MSDTVQGADVSKYQSSIPSGIEFLIAKATEGTQPDPSYEKHIADARAANLITGAYHFNYGPLAVAPQVTAFLINAGPVDLYALDYEGSTRFTRAQTREFIQRVQATGRKIGLYASESVFFDAGQDWDWVANYSQVPSRPWHIWQYGPFHGADGNRFNGTLDELRAFVGAATEDPMIPISVNTAGPYTVELGIGDQLYDQSLKPLVKASVVASVDGYFLTGTGYVAVVITTGGQRQLAFVKAADVTYTPVSPTETPAADCSAIQAQLDTAAGRIRQAITALGGTQP